MKKLLFLPAFALIVSDNGLQAATIDAFNIAIQGGSNSTVSWRAPLNHKYKVSVFVPNTGTASNATYFVYPKGKSLASISCSSEDANYPCFQIPINQALNKNKWVQLKLNNNALTAWLFTKNIGFVAVGAANLSTTETLGLSTVRFVPVNVYPAVGYSKITNDGTLLGYFALLGTEETKWACSRDNISKLMWEVKTDDGGLRDKDNTYSWYNTNPLTNGGNSGYQNRGSCTGGISCDTENYVKAVNRRKLCGYNDWRMPTADELLTLVKTAYYPINIDSNYFPNTLNRLFWTSTIDNSAEGAMCIDFEYGNKSYCGSRSFSLGTRLVRTEK